MSPGYNFKDFHTNFRDMHGESTVSSTWILWANSSLYTHTLQCFCNSIFQLPICKLVHMSVTTYLCPPPRSWWTSLYRPRLQQSLKFIQKFVLHTLLLRNYLAYLLEIWYTCSWYYLDVPLWSLWTSLLSPRFQQQSPKFKISNGSSYAFTADTDMGLASTES